MVNKQIQQSDDSESYEEHRVEERVKGNGAVIVAMVVVPSRCWCCSEAVVVEAAVVVVEEALGEDNVI